MSTSAVYELPRPIWVSWDAFDQHFESHIGPVRATVIMPKLLSPAGLVGPPELSGVPAGVLGPIAGPRPVSLHHYDRSAAVIDPEWATEFAANHPPRATAVRAIGLELHEFSSATGDAHLADTNQIVDATSRSLDLWFGQVAEWVSILTGQDLYHRDQLFSASPMAPGFRRWTGSCWQPASVRYTIPNVDPVQVTDLGEIFARQHDESPPLEWQLLLSGCLDVDRGYNRRAVIELATAAEVCLAARAHRSDSTEPRPDRGPAEKWSKWLKKHDSFYAEDHDLRAGLVEVRNDAVHEGKSPSNDQTRRAYDCALRIVKDNGRPRAPWRQRPHPLP